MKRYMAKMFYLYIDSVQLIGYIRIHSKVISVAVNVAMSLQHIKNRHWEIGQIGIHEIFSMYTVTG